ncbi:MAG: hypothetical protein Q7R30_22825 [Acidobacteriota bacterium]|nr:hypothetical protein [Acidobacteriota bacterium]
MNFDKAEKGCVRAHPRAETRMLCSECLTALMEQAYEAGRAETLMRRGPGRPQQPPSMREEILEALLADGCPHGCVDTCGFTVRIKRMLAAVASPQEAARG